MPTVESNAERHAQINGITVSYQDAGDGEVPIIFIHGFPFDKATWQPQIDFLKNNNRVIAYDIRGFGHSSADREIPSIDLFANDLIALMDQLGIKKAIVCGLSMGGYILMNALGRYPERFEAVILSDTQCIADSEVTKEKRYKTIRQIETEGLSAYTEDLLKALFCKNTLENKKELVESIRKMILSISPQTITATLHALALRRESCSLLKTVVVPTLIICGKEDSITPVSQSESLFNDISYSKMVTIEQAGHLSNLEQPEAFNEHLSNFVLKCALPTPVSVFMP